MITAYDVIRQSSAVLFDFDGPLCDVFAGLPAPIVARRIEELSGCRFDTDDPLTVLRLVSQKCPARAAAVEDALISAEVEAVQSSLPEQAGVRALRALAHARRKVGIVTNNSPESVGEFLVQHALVEAVPTVVGRPYRHPHLMKPDPWSVRRAVQELDSLPSETVLIGDSLTDIEASREAGVKCIAFANKSQKVALFRATGAVVIDAMDEIELAALSFDHRH
jgi:phosphoglycolate phosphatase